MLAVLLNTLATSAVHSTVSAAENSCKQQRLQKLPAIEALAQLSSNGMLSVVPRT
jgi:hypothetical protein